MKLRSFIPFGVVAALSCGVQCWSTGPQPSRDESRNLRDAPRASTGRRGRQLDCKIISIYVYKGRPTLHLECPPGVAPGQLGHVIHGCGEPAGGRPVAELKVIRVAPPYAIAETTLRSIICRSWARIYLTQTDPPP